MTEYKILLKNLMEYYEYNARYSFTKIYDGIIEDNVAIKIYHDKSLLNSRKERVYIICPIHEISRESLESLNKTLENIPECKRCESFFIGSESELELVGEVKLISSENKCETLICITPVDFYLEIFSYIFDILKGKVNDDDVADFIDRTVTYENNNFLDRNVENAVNGWLDIENDENPQSSLNSSKGLMIVGERGIGKTYLLKKVFLWRLEAFRKKPLSAPFPIFIEIHELFHKLSFERSFEVYVSKFLADGPLDKMINPVVIEGLMKFKLILCLFDGLDETLKYNSSSELEKVVRDIFSTVPFETQIIATSRSTKYSSNEKLQLLVGPGGNKIDGKFRAFEVLKLDEFSNDSLKAYIKKRNLKFSESDVNGIFGSTILDLCKIPAYGETLKLAVKNMQRFEDFLCKSDQNLRWIVKLEYLIFHTALVHNVKRNKALVDVDDDLTFGVEKRDRLLCNLALNIFENDKDFVESQKIAQEFTLIFLHEKCLESQELLVWGETLDFDLNDYISKQVVENAVNDIRSQSLFEFDKDSLLQFIKPSVYCYYVAKRICKLLAGNETEVFRAVRAISKLNKNNADYHLIYEIVKILLSCGVNEIGKNVSTINIKNLVKERILIDKELVWENVQKVKAEYEKDYNPIYKGNLIENAKGIFGKDLFSEKESVENINEFCLSFISEFKGSISLWNSKLVPIIKNTESLNPISLLVTPYTITNQDFYKYLNDTSTKVQITKKGQLDFVENVEQDVYDHPRSWNGAHGIESCSDNRVLNVLSNHYHLFHMAPNIVSKQAKNESETYKSEPVRWVSFLDCALFCNWLSKKLGLDQCYKIGINQVSDDKEQAVISFNEESDGFRLPIESEWRRIAATDKSMNNGSPFYKEIDPVNNLDVRLEASLKRKELLYCESFEDINGVTSVLNTYSNQYGVFGMYGNLREWVQPEEDGILTEIKEGAIIGCSSTLGPDSLNFNFPVSRISLTSTNHDVGFRVVRNIPINA